MSNRAAGTSTPDIRSKNNRIHLPSSDGFLLTLSESKRPAPSGLPPAGAPPAAAVAASGEAGSVFTPGSDFESDEQPDTTASMLSNNKIPQSGRFIGQPRLCVPIVRLTGFGTAQTNADERR